MRIDWSKVPRGTPVKEMGGDEPYLFLGYEDDGVVVQDISGREFVFAPEEVILYSIADFKKYAVPDIKETARRIVDRAADSLDEGEAGERLIDEMVGALLSVEDVARAYLDGKTVLYRPVGSGVGGWIVARGTHNIDFDKYEYRVVAKQPSGSMQYSPFAEGCDKTAPEFRKEPVDEKPVLKIREPLTNTDVDRATVERFNELSKAARLERLSSDGWVPTIYDSYRLRPTPRYRPYDPAKDSICLPKFCEAQIHTESDGELAVIEAVNTHGVVARFYDGDGNHRTTAHITWEALAQWWRGEDNEPFGVKL